MTTYQDIKQYDTRMRSLVKSFSWRILGSLITGLGAYGLTSNLRLSLYISLGEFVAKIVLFYCHERLWQSIPLGISLSASRGK